MEDKVTLLTDRSLKCPARAFCPCVLLQVAKKGQQIGMDESSVIPQPEQEAAFLLLLPCIEAHSPYPTNWPNSLQVFNHAKSKVLLVVSAITCKDHKGRNVLTTRLQPWGACSHTIDRSHSHIL